MVRITNNTQLLIAQIDNMTIMPCNKSDIVSLHNVYHVPGIKKNLLSVSQLITSGNYVLVGPEDVKVYEDVKIITDNRRAKSGVRLRPICRVCQC